MSRTLPARIFPPRFVLFFIHQAISLPTTKPFSIVEIFGYPSEQTTLVVLDADGPHIVQIEDVGVHTLVPPIDGNTRLAYSTSSIQDAFDAAVAQFPPPPPKPDLLTIANWLAAAIKKRQQGESEVDDDCSS